MSFHLSPRRLTAAAALGVAAVLACAGPASAATGPSAAAGFVVANLVDGNHVVAGGFAQDGASADAISTLLAAGGQADAVTRIDAYLKTAVDAYTDPTGANGYGPTAGGLGKLAIAAEATGQDPHAYGGYDLLKLITDSQCTTVTATNNCTAVGQYANVYSSISQAVAIIALQRSPVAGDHLTSTSAGFTRLLDLRCADGLFTGSTDAGAVPCATGDVDASAYAIQALGAVLGPDDATVTAALTALAARQDATTGGFSSSGQGAVLNTNSTGVALSAFSLQPTTFAAVITRATGFVENLQQADDGRYAFSATDDAPDTAQVATIQALLGVLGRNLAGIVVAAPPTTTPPTTTAPTAGSPAPASASAPELAATGVASGHLTTELLLAAVALVGGGALVRVGARRLPAARHRG